MDNQLGRIQHIVQLMLENRSFDQMLGFLYADRGNISPAGQPYDGLTGRESNPDGSGRDVPVYKIEANSNHPYLMPGADPGEGFYNTNMQLFSTQHPKPGARPNNLGFVANFKSAIAADRAKHYQDTLPDTIASQIMGMYAPESLPVMSALARAYAVCDRWHASVPTQTIPNRAFAAAATSQGRLDNHVKLFTCPSIFGRLSERNIDWGIYGYNGAPLTRMDFSDTINADPGHFGHFSDFKKRAAAGTLPAYTFLEPSFGAGGNSQHPNYNVALGEQLLYDLYHILLASPGWNDTLLLITYDEHGGNYDHVAPPDTATPPDNLVGEFERFDFRRYGVRIPALLISPRIRAGTVFRPRSGVVDHSSVLKTIALRWDLQPLTKRDANAPDLGDALTLLVPRTDDALQGVLVPVALPVYPSQSLPSELEKIHAARVAQLPLPDEHAQFKHTAPELATSGAIHDYIEGRTAAWNEHLRRHQ
ncbi:phospholipase C [Oxalobacteraceae bacterium GrIS 1.11]